MMTGLLRRVGLFFLLFVTCAHGYIHGVSIGDIKTWKPDAIGYNGKMQGDPWRTNPFDNAVHGSNLVDLLVRSKVKAFRYPAGTIANYWDWTLGRDERGTDGYYMTSNLKIAADAADLTTFWVVNMLTKDLQHNLDGLQQAENEGFDIDYVEMGNEFYLADADYVTKFPSGVKYGQDCQTWINAIKSQFPGVKCAIVTTMKTSSRGEFWHDALEPAVVDGDGTAQQQADQWNAFNQPEGPAIMLAQPNADWNSLRSGNDLPADVDIWITEFNLKDSNGAVRQTWANGLFNANQIHAFLQDGRVSRILLHNWLSSNKQAMFGETTELNHVLTNHGQGDLTTTPYEFGAGGQVIRMFAEVMGGATNIAPLNIELNPQVNVTGYDSYDAVYGYRFYDGSASKAILVNTSDTAYDIDTTVIAPSNSHVRQLWGDPHTYVTGENETLNRTTSLTLPKTLRLPAYSVITIGGPENSVPTGSSANAPAFTSDPISKPNATAYSYYSQYH
jgi:hypothetical protein